MRFEKNLVLDDELVIRKTFEELLRRKGYSVVCAATVTQAEELMRKGHYDLLFADVNLPDGNGVDLLRRLALQADSPVVIIMTGDSSIGSAVECMRAGAFDYLIKPFAPTEITMLVEKAESFSQVVKVGRYLNQEQAQGSVLIGESPQISRLRGMIAKVAPTDASVLINGENGTGKELVAKELFKASGRSQAPFIKVNCAAISETLIESEFFGHEKGSFTGANERREGRFELAHGGTILLDEVSEISPRVQAKLLRVLQEQEFERVGGNKTIKVDVRVLATTNRDLQRSVQSGEFREDLYYRLNVFPLTVPALRERGSDVLLLARLFLERSSRRYGAKVKGFSDAAASALMRYFWPGNVRELQNLVERAVILTDGPWVESDALAIPDIGLYQRELAREQPPGKGAAVSAPIELGAGILPSLEEMEKQHILLALERTGGNRTHATALLKISIRTLRNKLHQYRIEDGGAEEPENESEHSGG